VIRPAVVAPALFTALALGLLLRGVRLTRTDRLRALIGGPLGEQALERGASLQARIGRGLSRRRSIMLLGGLGSAGLWVGLHLAGIPGAVACAVAGVAGPKLLANRNAGHRIEEMDRQLADLTESVSAAVQSGLSIGQALDYAASEAAPPLSEITDEFLAHRRIGMSFDAALERLSERIGSDDARLLALVLGVHHRAGGNVAGALSEVASTVRHRVALRRELRALTAQGRISGVILGALPIGFFLVLAVTAHHELAPVYASFQGIAMVSAGFVMEALAFVWIRRLLRVGP
jgi:tight adherence protein B